MKKYFKKTHSWKPLFCKKILFKTHFKIFFACSLLLSLLIPFCGCRQKSVTPSRYVNDVTAREISDAVMEKIPVSGGYEAYNSDFMQFYLPDILPLVDDYHVVYASAPNDYTEIGIFYVSDPANIDKVENALERYLEQFRTTYLPQAKQYDPAELEKLKDADCDTYGNYVIYTIMRDDAQEICESTIYGILCSESKPPV